MSRIALGRAIVRGVYDEARAENIGFMAGSVAYHAFVSLIPFLLVLLVALQVATDAAVARDVVVGVGGYLSPNNGDLLADAVTEASASTGLSVLGVLTLLWGTLKVFRTLDKAFSDIYESEAANPLSDQLADGVVVLFGVGAAVAIAALAGTVISLDGSTLAGSVLVWLAFVAALSLAFFPIFYVFPDEDVTVREVIPGTVFAAAGWATLETAFQEYAAVAGSNDAYGLLGAVLLLVTWLYVSGLVILVGAALNAVLAGRSKDVAPIPWNDPGESPIASALSSTPVSSSTAADGAGATVGSGASASSTATHDGAAGANAIDRAERVSAIADALEDADPGTTARVNVNGDTYVMPIPGTVNAETTTVARPGFLGGPETRTTLELVWEHDEQDT